MNKLKLIGIGAALLLGASLSFVVRAQSPPRKPISPELLVANLYRQQERVFQSRSRALLDKYFDKSLADLTWMELLHWKEREESDGEPFDYVLYNFGYGEANI